jgi:DNA-damage-inducible protein J
MSSTATMEPISAKLQHSEKETFISTCESIGTSPSNAIRMFVSAFNKRGGFPFDPANPYEFSQETLEAMEDARTGKNLIGPFDTVDDMFAALEED